MKTIARVSVTVDVELHQPFPDDMTVADVRRKASDEAIDLVRNRMSATSGVRFSVINSHVSIVTVNS